jgi:transposase
MILSKSLSASQMTKAAEYSKRSIINISNNLRQFGNVGAPATRVGRRRSITPPMIEALCDRLLEKPGLYVDERTIFLWDEFRVQVTNSSLKRALASVGWSKNVTRQRAKEQNADLRDFYIHNLSDFQSHHLVYLDESGCDKRIGFRRTGWSPLGTAPLQVANFHRDQWYQILRAYCQDGIVLSRIFQGSTDSAVFEDFIGQLLRHCGRWPEPKSVLVIDNASFHHSDRIEELCTKAGVKLVYLDGGNENRDRERLYSLSDR